MERFVQQALVLSTVDFGESDRMVTLLTEHRGKLTAFAAGARKSKRRFAGALEPCTLVKAQLVERHGTTFRLDGVDIERSHLGLRSDLSFISRALYSVELVRELTRDREPHPELYALVVDYLLALDDHRAGPTSLLAFELHALAAAGFMPRFDGCALCEQELGEGAQFDVEHGGMVCDGCLGRVKTGRLVPVELFRALRGLQKGARTPLSHEHRRRARELLNLFIAHQIGRKLRSVEFLEQLGVD